MQSNVSVLIATILAVIIIVMYPIYNIATRNDSISNNLVVEATTTFVDEVRNKGYIKSSDYNSYINKLNKTGNRYEVEMEIYKPVLLEVVESPEENKEYEEKYEIKYTDDILRELKVEEYTEEIASEEGIVNEEISYLDKDYKFYVRVKNTNITQAQILFGRLFRGKADERIVVNYGGLVYTNEWEKGEDAEVASSNIFISRPLDNDLNEYKYEHIAEIYDPTTDKTTDIYGIRVEFNDDDVEKGSGIVKFILTYKDIKLFKDETGNEIGAEDDKKEERTEHIEKYIQTVGFDAVEKKVIAENKYEINESGLYDAEYVIEIKDIQYDYENNPFIMGKVRIKAGSAESVSGQIGQLNSKEFIIMYTTNRPIVMVKTTPDVIYGDKKFTVEPEHTMDFKIEVEAKLISAAAKVEKVVINVTKDDTAYFTKEMVRSEATKKEDNITLEFPAVNLLLGGGKYTLEVYAVDSRNRLSEKEIVIFEVEEMPKEIVKNFKYINAKKTNELENRINNVINVKKDDCPNGYRIKSYNLKVYLPNHTPAPLDFFWVSGNNNYKFPSDEPSTIGITSLGYVFQGTANQKVVSKITTYSLGVAEITNTYYNQKVNDNIAWQYRIYDIHSYLSSYSTTVIPFKYENMRPDGWTRGLYDIEYQFLNWRLGFAGCYGVNSGSDRNKSGFKVNITQEVGENIDKLTFCYRISPKHAFWKEETVKLDKGYEYYDPSKSERLTWNKNYDYYSDKLFGKTYYFNFGEDGREENCTTGSYMEADVTYEYVG